MSLWIEDLFPAPLAVPDIHCVLVRHEGEEVWVPSADYYANPYGVVIKDNRKVT
jgi:hypothetical protein